MAKKAKKKHHGEHAVEGKKSAPSHHRPQRTRHADGNNPVGGPTSGTTGGTTADWIKNAYASQHPGGVSYAMKPSNDRNSVASMVSEGTGQPDQALAARNKMSDQIPPSPTPASATADAYATGAVTGMRRGGGVRHKRGR